MIITSCFCDIAKRYNIAINNVYEIGSLHGKDAEIMRALNNVNPSDVYIFEAHSEFSKDIKASYPSFNIVNTAISDKNGYTNFNTVVKSTGNLGMSSIRSGSNAMKVMNELNSHTSREQYNTTAVPCTRMDTWIQENNIKNIDMLKIDVEGCTYECLQGFGDELDIVKIMHIEAEHIECWEGQTLYPDIKRFLEEHNFKLIHIVIGGPTWAQEQQSDSVWINKRFLEK